MKVVIPGGTGQVGALLARSFMGRGDEVVVLSRGGSSPARVVPWDAKTLGSWATEIDGADVVINLAGRSVNCRYTDANMKEMMDSRVDSTRVVGEAVARAARPPKAWLQMSTATIYAHSRAPNDETTGLIGGNELGVPAYWKFSVDIARNWEAAQAAAATPSTRKVALRTSMVMSPDAGGIFDVLLDLTRKRLGGPIAGGTQYVSWIHDRDFVRAIELLIARDDLAGPINVASPNPLPQREFQRALRAAAGIKLGLPATAWMAKLGAVVLRTDAELTLKSRRVVPGRLLAAGFAFEFPEWSVAARDLIARRAR